MQLAIHVDKDFTIKKYIRKKVEKLNVAGNIVTKEVNKELNINI
jgi:hypothetical protein